MSCSHGLTAFLHCAYSESRKKTGVPELKRRGTFGFIWMEDRGCPEETEAVSVFFFIHNVYDDMMYLLFLYWRTEKKLQSLQKQGIAPVLRASPEAEGVSLPEETGPDCVRGLGLSTGNPLSLTPGYSPGSNCHSPDARPSRHSCSRGARRWRCGTHCGYSDNRCGSCSTSCGIHHRPL